MKIAEIHLYPLALPVKDGPYTMSLGALSELQSLLVKLVADNGVIGWGETCPLGPVYAQAHANGARAALDTLAPGLIGTELLPLPLQRRMDSLLNGHRYAKAAVDIAMYDALAKSLGVRVVDLLGGALTERVPSYYAIGIETPDDAARIAAERCSEGYPRLQLKVAGRSIETDIAAIRKVAEVVSGNGVRLAIDANRGWTTRDALLVSRACADIPLVIEQPCASNEELRRLRPHLQHPLYIDETSFDIATVIDTVGSGLADGFGFKLTRLGGLQAMTTARDICAASNLPHTCDDAWGGDLLAAACTHLGATVRADLLEGVWLAAPYIDGHYDRNGGLQLESGHIRLPAGPGLGVLPDEAMLGTAAAIYR